MIANIRIKDVVIKGRPGSELSGFYVGPQGITGWFDSVEIRRTVVQRVQAHGDFDLPGTLDARVVSITGLAFAQTVEELEYMRSRITGLLAQGDSAQIVVEYGGATTWANARLGAQTKFAPKKGGSLIADFQIQLWCPDPRKYGLTRGFNAPSGTTLNVVHRGNFPAAPLIEVFGSMPGGYTVTGPAGSAYTVTRSVLDSHPHFIDMSTGELVIDDVVVAGAVASADTWAVPGGSPMGHRLNPASGSGTMAITVKDTFI